MLTDQARQADSTMPIAAMTLDFERIQLALKLAQRDRSAAAHYRTPKVLIIVGQGVSRFRRSHPGDLAGTEGVGTDQSVPGRGGTCPVG